MILDFFNDPGIKMLVFSSNNAGVLAPYYEFISNSKGKTCYFIRQVPEVLTIENIRDVCLFYFIHALVG